MTFRRLLALLAVLGLIAAGCGGDRGEDESGGVSDPATDTTEAGSTAAAAGDLGDLTGVCGPNEGGGAVPDAGPEEIQGITADAITLGTVSDPGFEGRPGLNIELHVRGHGLRRVVQRRRWDQRQADQRQPAGRGDQ